MQTSFKGNYHKFILLCFIIGFASCKKEINSTETSNGLTAENSTLSKTINPISATMSVITTGLNHPRGLKFGPDGIYMLQKQVQDPLHCVAHKVALNSNRMFSRLILVALPGDAYPELIHHQVVVQLSLIICLQVLELIRTELMQTYSGLQMWASSVIHCMFSSQEQVVAMEFHLQPTAYTELIQMEAIP
jgi:hypothetical protein